ncbi:polysaccharide deacetylase family protein [Blastopirellula marina]|uniref:Xylanase n=2 Tax=Blastopirellula marina TaxID=124 RepID=A0A2S8F5M6_9BACT|nr:xylanase [Blastopirellula marina]PTL41380.1 polysaccharide deacetylase family protein [Blastopirellula marina]
MKLRNMNALKSAIVDTYTMATWPWRARFRQVHARVGMAPVMVLFYHRVADRDVTPWTITCDDFRRHLDYLQAKFEIVSLAEGQRRIAMRFNTDPCVAITFDDGYGDNSEFAIPELNARQMPATYFVTLGNVLSGEPFAHDAKLGISARPNSVAELREMIAGGNIEIGGHTRTHADIGSLHDPARIQDEVIDATRELEQLIDQPIRYFAFPFGLPANLNDAAINLLRQNGILAFCSAYGGYNFPGDDPYHIQRIHGDSELSRLRNWLTIDPRKVAGVPRYQPRYTRLPESSGEQA